jgi:hypothetical protein
LSELWDNRNKATKQSSGVVQVTEIQVVNSRGAIVGIIGSDSAGDGFILIGNHVGEAAVKIGIDSASDGEISILEKNITVSSLGVDNNGNGVIGVTSSDVKLGSAVLTIDDTGDGSLGITNKNGAVSAALGVDAKGNGALGILNSEEQPIAALAADDSGNGQLGVGEGGKQAVVKASVSSSGVGIIETKNQSQSTQWSSQSPVTGSTGNTGDNSSKLLGDLDNDGDVDFSDFLRFAANFGKSLTG